MISASGATSLLEHPASPVHQHIADPILRRFLIGVVVGLTIIAIVYSPWGKQSGAHINPVVTFTFFRLGKIRPADALFYILAQFIGAGLGLWLAARFLREIIAHPDINYIVTVPGTRGAIVAFLAELLISFGVMMLVLVMSNTPKLSRYTGLFVGLLVVLYITLEAPLSGMSMNPARTLASALPAQIWTGIWIYFTAPVLGMGLAAELYVRIKGRRSVRCAKLHHDNSQRCIFHCGYRQRNIADLSDRLPTEF